ncbi:MAG: hypothetical protein WD423_12525 [Rhodothermales bacterium]
MAVFQETGTEIANGAAMAAYLSAGIGSFAMGFVVLLNSIGLFPFPALYAPAGGVTTRTTAAVLLWLGAWVLLHRRWKAREIDSRKVLRTTLALIALGVLLTFPPLWQLL